MLVGIEMYFEFNVSGHQQTFRCFVPQDTDRLASYSSAPNTRVINYAGFRGLVTSVQCANMVIDVANKVVYKDRHGRFLSVVDDVVVPIPITESDVSQFRRAILLDYSEMLTRVDLMTRRPDPSPITEFKDDYRFLSNFHPATFMWNHIMWHNSEAAYQAAKSSDIDVWLDFADMKNPAQVKRAGKLVRMRPDWNEVKVGIMRDIVFEKFNQNPHLREQLLDTGTARLEEGNMWKDTFWGVCPPGSDRGENHLGNILMDIRQEFRTISF